MVLNYMGISVLTLSLKRSLSLLNLIKTNKDGIRNLFFLSKCVILVSIELCRVNFFIKGEGVSTRLK